LTGAILLGIKRSEKGLHRFNAFVTSDDLPEFNRFLADVLNTQHKKICKIDLSFNAHLATASVRIEAVPNEEGSECRMVVIDITAEKQAQKLQDEREQYLRALLEEVPSIVWQPKDEQDVPKLPQIIPSRPKVLLSIKTA
jgi:PAS domain-containing protein